MLENIRGHSRGSIPPLRMPSPLPHDLCHEWNVSRLLPADREAWRAASHGVTKSRTRLSNWTELITLLKKVKTHVTYPFCVLWTEILPLICKLFLVHRLLEELVTPLMPLLLSHWFRGLPVSHLNYCNSFITGLSAFIITRSNPVVYFPQHNS